jgi:hypothetical protein
MHPSLTISVSLSLRHYKPYEASGMGKHHSPERILSVSHLFPQEIFAETPGLPACEYSVASVLSQVSYLQVSCHKCPVGRTQLGGICKTSGWMHVSIIVMSGLYSIDHCAKLIISRTQPKGGMA